eukprot:gene5314-5850_t
MTTTALWRVLAFMVGARCTAALLRRFTAFTVQKKRLNTDSKSLLSDSASSITSITDLRKEYSSQALLETDPVVQQGPFKLFENWLNEACNAKTTEPNAMCLSTVKDNRPSARYVLLKGFDERGFVWYTNYQSRKGGELVGNPYAALTFWWGELERQVRIEGQVVKVSEEESDAYFQVRPRGSQIGAWSSNQSRPIAGRSALELQEQEVAQRFTDAQQAVPRPPHWGGFRLVPDRIEFWKGRGSRLHDRLVFEKVDEAWRLGRLQP